MALTRADKLTQSQKKQEYFSDFLNNFDKHPITNTLARITDEDSVKQAVKNLILTDLGERMFEPTVGSNIRKALFEPNDIVTVENLVFFIKNTLKQNEQRIRLLDISVYSRPDNNLFTVNLVFAVINNPGPITLDFILRRVR